MGSGKLILLLIAMGMIGLVLLLGYKLDKYEEKGKIKEKINNKRDNKEYDSYSDYKSLKNNYEEVEKTSSFGTSSFEFNKDISKNNEYSEDLDKTAVIEKIDLSKLEIAEEDTSYEEPEFDGNLEDFEEEIYEYNDEYNYDNEYDYDASSSSTMVFNTASVNEELEIVDNVKGYNFDKEEIAETKKEEKTKATRKTTAKKSTTKKTETKPKTAQKTTTKKVEEKPKATRKTTAKKSTTKKTETKPKTAKKTTTKKVEEKPKVARKTTKTATTKTTKKTVKATKINEKNKNRNI